jgi:plasmid stability protein
MSKMIVREKPTTVTILVDRELRGRLERAAREHDRSLGGEVRAVLRAHLERDDDEGGTRHE